MSHAAKLTKFDTNANQAGEPLSEIQELRRISEALQRSQAVIELETDGTIHTANENFLQAVGYSLEEIQGKHHKMFCDPSYVRSPDYKNFWEKLNQGEFISGEFKRLGKGGKEIWLQASYNPVLDEAGDVIKIVKFATDITDQKQKIVELSGKVDAISKSQAVIEFNLDGTVITANDNFLKTLGYDLREIQGKHHRTFCDPKYSESFEYRQFWDKLNRD